MPKRGKEDAMTQWTADRARDELADRRGRRYPVDRSKTQGDLENPGKFPK